MLIDYSPEFKRLFKKLSKEVKLEALKKEAIFRVNMYDQRLKTHKLSGKLKGKMSFSINYSQHIIFSMQSKGIVRFHSVGDHDIYK